MESSLVEWRGRQAAPFIYLTPSSPARTSVSGALTHSMPETRPRCGAIIYSIGQRGRLGAGDKGCKAGGEGSVVDALSFVSSERTFGLAGRISLQPRISRDRLTPPRSRFPVERYRFAWRHSSIASSRQERIAVNFAISFLSLFLS